MRNRWDSCAEVPLLPGMMSSQVASPLALPPPRPRKAMDFRPSRPASWSAATMFGDLPLEVTTTTRSPGFESPATCRAKTCSKPKSFPMHVIREPSEERATAGSGRRLRSKRPTSSVAKWAASAALPPFPHIRSLPPARRVPTISSAAASMAGRISPRDSSVRMASASDFSNVIPQAKRAADELATEFFDVLGRFQPAPGRRGRGACSRLRRVGSVPSMGGWGLQFDLSRMAMVPGGAWGAPRGRVEDGRHGVEPDLRVDLRGDHARQALDGPCPAAPHARGHRSGPLVSQPRPMAACLAAASVGRGGGRDRVFRIGTHERTPGALPHRVDCGRPCRPLHRPAHAAGRRPGGARAMVRAGDRDPGGVHDLVANAAGPLTVIYMLAMRLPKMKYMGTTAVFFLLLNLFKLPFMVGLGLITRQSLAVSIVLAPAVLAGTWLGKWLLGWINQRAFEAIILALALLAGASDVYLTARSWLR